MITIDGRTIYAAYADECAKEGKRPMTYKEFSELEEIQADNIVWYRLGEETPYQQIQRAMS